METSSIQPTQHLVTGSGSNAAGPAIKAARYLKAARSN
tara:strand:- start:1164 stop:1277 length:114 start_codon:yes stop_codon:yes gene_type:complete